MSTPAKNILWLSISRIASLILLFVAYSQLFRYLGPYQTGQFQFVLSYVTLFGVVIDFGIQQYIIKKISEDRSQAKKYFHNFLAVEVVLAALVYGSMLAVAFYNGYEPIVIKAIMIAGLGAAIHGLTYPFLSVITAFYDLKKAAFLNFLSSLINVTVIFITIWTASSFVLLTVQQIIYASLAVVIYYFLVQKHIGKPEVLKGLSTLDWTLVKTIFKAALPFALLVGFSTVYNRIDVVLITKYLGYAETGLYTAAYKFFDLLAFFPAVVSHALYPLFATLMAQNDKAQIRDILEKYLRFMIAIALPVAVGGMLMAKPIVVLLAGEEFAGAAPVLAVLVWAPALLFIYIVVNSLVISQLTKFAMAITGVNVLVNIIGNIILLPRYGIVAAAAMTIASEALQGIFYFYFVRKKITDFRFFSLIWQPALASLIMGFVVWNIRSWNLFIVVAAAGLVYGFILLILRFFKKDDIQFVKSLLSRAV
jgi:O-antigen/teichoic acid export membrane protein